jgi:hypothetical protein
LLGADPGAAVVKQQQQRVITDFVQLLMLARRVSEQQQRQRWPKVYSLNAAEVEFFGKGIRTGPGRDKRSRSKGGDISRMNLTRAVLRIA